MKKRRKIHWTLPFGLTGMHLLLLAVLLSGGVVGCWFAVATGPVDAGALRDYLSDYMIVIRDHGISRSGYTLIFEKLWPIFLTALLGFTTVSLIGIPVLFATQSFLFSFSVCCFYRVFGWRGLFPAFSLFGLSALLWFPALFLLGMWGVGRFFNDHTTTSYTSPYSLSSHYRVVLCFVLVILCILLEVSVVPVLLRAAVHFVL